MTLDHSSRDGEWRFKTRGLPQATTIERNQPLPMPLRCGLVVAPALREGEAVMDAGVELDLTDGPGVPEQHTESLHHRQGCEIVMLGTGYVEFTLDLAQ